VSFLKSQLLLVNTGLSSKLRFDESLLVLFLAINQDLQLDHDLLTHMLLFEFEGLGSFDS
jgi:hypothetical protein